MTEKLPEGIVAEQLTVYKVVGRVTRYDTVGEAVEALEYYKSLSIANKIASQLAELGVRNLDPEALLGPKVFPLLQQLVEVSCKDSGQ